MPSPKKCEFDRAGTTAVCRVCGREVRNAPAGRLVAKCRGPKPEPIPSLSFLQKAKNFAMATAQHVAKGMPMAPDEEILRRHSICLACEFYKNNSCTKCGCPVYREKKFISKLAWADQSCPVGKWGNEQ